jgi:hypothetical protein
MLGVYTTDDVIREAETMFHRFKPEPLFSRTGTGSLSSASTQERAREVEHSMALTQSLRQRALNLDGGAIAADSEGLSAATPLGDGHRARPSACIA